VAAAEQGGADWIHVDVMDGHFVPNITIGPPVVAAVRKATSLPLDVHLMIESPDRHLAAFAEAGASVITVHQEACPHLHRTLERIRELGAQPGVAINPATPADTLREIASFADLILVMSVNPGFGGQKYIRTSTAKIAKTRQLLADLGAAAELEVDGGVDAGNAGVVAGAGATVLVAGNAVFRHPDGVAAAIGSLRSAGEAGARGTKLA
jgi:ribulose-phosphate 3-epimerase